MNRHTKSVWSIQDAAKASGLDMSVWAPAFAQLFSLADRLGGDGRDDTSLAREFRQTYQPVIEAINEAKRKDTSAADTVAQFLSRVDAAKE